MVPFWTLRLRDGKKFSSHYHSLALIYGYLIDFKIRKFEMSFLVSYHVLGFSFGIRWLPLPSSSMTLIYTFRCATSRKEWRGKRIGERPEIFFSAILYGFSGLI